jgi:hypothetical protein
MARMVLPSPESGDNPSGPYSRFARSQGLLRHSNVSTTERHYIKDVPEKALSAMNLIEMLCHKKATEESGKRN